MRAVLYQGRRVTLRELAEPVSVGCEDLPGLGLSVGLSWSGFVLMDLVEKHSHHADSIFMGMF